MRAAAFEWLKTQVDLHGDVLPWTLLIEGFDFGGSRVPLVSMQGIFKPAILEVPISIRTSPSGPYHDAFRSDGLLRYAYRGENPDHRDNRGLRFALEQRLPLVYFHRMVKGRYLATWPVYIVRDDPGSLSFFVAVDDAAHISLPSHATPAAGEDSAIRRAYVTTLARRRLHLEPMVSNGLALCRLHHAAFDRFFIGIRPNYVIEVRRDLLDEEDGPTLEHAIQGLHGERISLPRRKSDLPSVELLGSRFDRFLEVAASGR